MKTFGVIALVVVIGVTFGKLWTTISGFEEPPAMVPPPKGLPPPADPALRRAHIAYEVGAKLREVTLALDTSLLIRLGLRNGRQCDGLLERVRDGEFWESTQAEGFQDVLRQAGFTRLACEEGREGMWSLAIK